MRGCEQYIIKRAHIRRLFRWQDGRAVREMDRLSKDKAMRARNTQVPSSTWPHQYERYDFSYLNFELYVTLDETRPFMLNTQRFLLPWNFFAESHYRSTEFRMILIID